MGTEIALVERQLQPLVPRFDALLRGSIIDGRSLVQQVLVMVEKTPAIAECTPQSIINGTNTAAVLHLPIDGATGQFYLLPIRNKGILLAQPCIGFKGFNTIAWRGGMTINAGVVREGDHEWDYREGSGGFVRHKRKLDNEGKIIAAWACGSSDAHPDAVKIMGIGEIETIMKNSPAYRSGAPTVWKSDFRSMAEKSPKRQLSKVIPWQIDDGRYLKAARVEEAFEEQGRISYLGQSGEVVVDAAPSLVDQEPNATPAAETLTRPQPQTDPVLEKHKQEGRDKAQGQGLAGVRQWWSRLPRPAQIALERFKDELKDEAERAERGESNA